jgi:hypothetical protein
VGGQPIRWWLTLSPKGSDSASLNSLDPCPSRALFIRPTQTGAGGRLPVPYPATSDDSDSCKLRSPNLSVTESRDPRTHLEL